MCIDKRYLNEVLTIFNSYDNNLKFTYEIEQNNTISFLDLSLMRQNNKIITNWFQKSVASGRIMNYTSNHPIKLKKNIVFNLTDRAILLSHKTFHKQNINIVTQTLLNNGYPIQFINKNIKIRLNKHKFNKNNNVEKSILNNNYILSLPFNSNYNKLSSILRPYNIKTIPKIDKSLSDIIVLGKDKTNNIDKTNVVYQISCHNCPVKYVGETKRSLKTRINEHKRNKNPDSVISAHIKNYNHDFNWLETKILDYESNYFKRIISEMIHIKSNQNSINKKEDVKNLNHLYFPIINRMKVQ